MQRQANPDILVPPRSRARFILVSALACTILFAACLIIYTRYNEFPTVYHPDEQFKGRAIVDGKFKYTQPLLLTSTAGAASWISGKHRTFQQAVIVGRWTSAVFAAAAIVLFALAAGWQQGPWAAIAVAIALACSHRLLIWAHYMKEDTALLMALGAFLLAGTAFCSKPGRRTLVLLGCSCGLSIAAKYIGIITIPLAWYIVRCRLQADIEPAQAQALRGKSAVRRFLLGCVVVFAIVQIPAFIHPIDFLDDVWYEVRHPIAGHRGLAQPILWNSPFLRMYVNETPIGVGLLAAAYVVVSLARWRRLQIPQRAALILAGGYGALLLCSSIAEPRHLVPITALTYVFAALAVARVVAALPGGIPVRLAALAAACVIFILPFIRYARPYLREFRCDTRLVLANWISEHLSPNDAIAFEAYAALPDDNAVALGAFAPSMRLKQRLIEVRYMPKLGTLEEIRKLGCTHVAVAEPAYGRYFEPGIRPSRRERQEFEQRRAWYQRLFAEGKLELEVRPEIDMNANTSPVVRLYRLP